jgi:hypothetical protein
LKLLHKGPWTEKEKAIGSLNKKIKSNRVQKRNQVRSGAGHGGRWGGGAPVPAMAGGGAEDLSRENVGELRR